MAQRTRARTTGKRPSDAESILGTPDASLLDIVDNVLSKGVVLTGDVTIGLAQVDLVYARLSLLLCAADRVLPNEDQDVITRHSRRHAARVRASLASGIGDRGSEIRSNRESRTPNHE